MSKSCFGCKALLTQNSQVLSARQQLAYAVGLINLLQQGSLIILIIRSSNPRPRLRSALYRYRCATAPVLHRPVGYRLVGKNSAQRVGRVQLRAASVATSRLDYVVKRMTRKPNVRSSVLAARSSFWETLPHVSSGRLSYWPVLSCTRPDFSPVIVGVWFKGDSPSLSF